VQMLLLQKLGVRNVGHENKSSGVSSGEVRNKCVTVLIVLTVLKNYRYPSIVVPRRNSHTGN